MTKPYSHTEQYIAQLKRIEQDISENRLEEAAQQLNQLAKAAPRDPRLFLLGSRMAEAAGNLDGVLLAARKAHELAPQWPVATIHLAQVLAKRGESQEAIAVAGLALKQAVAQATLNAELLSAAVSVARRFRQHTQALEWLHQADRFFPGDPNHRHQIALSMIDLRDLDGGIGLLTELIEETPGHPMLLSDRLRACVRAKKFDLAVVDGEALLAIDPNNKEWQFLLDVARGKTPESMPESTVRNLFDNYAAGFDQSLVVQLRYKLPRDVAALIHQWHPDNQGDVLDLGCGTGLLGACLGPIQGVVVGVDLSAEMLAQAARHGVYDKFHQVNVLDALQATPADLYHVIAALDVFVYIGDLESVVSDAHRILVPGGRFVFSCEAGAEDGPDFAMHQSLRYTHRRSYVQRLLEQSGFQEVQIDDRVIRYEAGQPVQGLLAVARKRTAEATKSAKRNPRASKTPRAET